MKERNVDIGNILTAEVQQTMKTAKDIIEAFENIVGEEHHKICEGLRCACHKETKAFLLKAMQESAKAVMVKQENSVMNDWEAGRDSAAGEQKNLYNQFFKE
jgi:hypothetical protein